MPPFGSLPGRAHWPCGRPTTSPRLLTARTPALEVELVTVTTTGDRRSDVPVWEIGGRGVFVREVQSAVLAGRADAAVHSAKDLQPVRPPACAWRPCRHGRPPGRPGRRQLAELGPGAPVATGSQRRRAQLAWLRPDLTFHSLRGNIATRLARIPREVPSWWRRLRFRDWAGARTDGDHGHRRDAPPGGPGGAGRRVPLRRRQRRDLLAPLDDPVARQCGGRREGLPGHHRRRRATCPWPATPD